MQFKFVVPVIAALAFAAPALAQDAQPGPQPMQKSEFWAKRHAEMCSNHYARAVGQLASLEVRLNLTAKQKSLFERWKKVKLASAKTQSDKCATAPVPRRDMPIMDGVKFRTAMLEQRLADLKAETPALEALVNSLDENQQVILKRAALHAMKGRMDRMDRFMGRHPGRGMGMMGGMGAGNPPPPPPAD